MGWLELLALLKRVLPLLARIAPMLETYVGARGGSRPETDATFAQLHNRLETEGASAAERHQVLVTALEAHTEQLGVITEEVRQLGLSDGIQRSQLKRMEADLNRLNTRLHTTLVAIVLLLLVCLGLLVVVLVRH